MSLFRRMKRPVQGYAQIVDTWQRPQHGAHGNCKMQLALDVPGVPPQVVEHHEWSMSPDAWPQKGMRVPVTVDADHPDRVRVDWDAAFSTGSGAAAPVVTSFFAANVRTDDTDERIAKLDALHAAGVISDEERAAAIRRLGGG